MVILGSNTSINSAFGEILLEEFGQASVQINPEVKLCKEGIERIKASHIVIIDLSSFNRDSRLFIRQIHELCPNTSILALHIYSEAEFIKPLIAAGASNYLLVNADKADILAAMRELIHKV